MSRSRRKNLVFPNCCCNTQKKWKQSYNRIFRRTSKYKLQDYLNGEVEDFIYEDVLKRPYANLWLTSPSDGFTTFEPLTEKEYKEQFLIHPEYFLRVYPTYEKYLGYLKRKIISK